jgi:hypothetical protein
VNYRYVCFRLVSQYGRLRAVPVGPAAEAFARIAGGTTLAPRVLKELADLGLPLMVDGSTTDRFRAQTDWGMTPPATEYRPGAEIETREGESL